MLSDTPKTTRQSLFHSVFTFLSLSLAYMLIRHDSLNLLKTKLYDSILFPCVDLDLDMWYKHKHTHKHFMKCQFPLTYSQLIISTKAHDQQIYDNCTTLFVISLRKKNHSFYYIQNLMNLFYLSQKYEKVAILYVGKKGWGASYAKEWAAKTTKK